jgi:hypothetical protein
MRMRTPIGARSQQLPLWPQCYPIQALRPAPAAQALVIAKTGRRTQVRPPLAQRRELALEAPRVANSISTMRGASDSQSDNHQLLQYDCSRRTLILGCHASLAGIGDLRGVGLQVRPSLTTPRRAQHSNQPEKYVSNTTPQCSRTTPN